MWDIVWVLPGHRSVSVSCHFLLQAPQCPCSVRKRFIRDHCCRKRSKPGFLIMGSHTRWKLTTWADFQLCLHRLLMSTGCTSSHSGFLDVSHRNGGLRISGWWLVMMQWVGVIAGRSSRSQAVKSTLCWPECCSRITAHLWLWLCKAAACWQWTVDDSLLYCQLCRTRGTSPLWTFSDDDTLWTILNWVQVFEPYKVHSYVTGSGHMRESSWSWEYVDACPERQIHVVDILLCCTGSRYVHSWVPLLTLEKEFFYVWFLLMS